MPVHLARPHVTGLQMRQAAVGRLLGCADAAGVISKWPEACQLVGELDPDLGRTLAAWGESCPAEMRRTVDRAAKVIESWICASNLVDR